MSRRTIDKLTFDTGHGVRASGPSPSIRPQVAGFLMATALLTALSSVVFASIGAGPALAQSAVNPPPQPAQTVPAAKARPAAKPPAKPAAEASPDAAQADGQAQVQLRQRIETLEEQINEMHVAVGTLDSLAKAGARAAPSSAGPGGGGPGGGGLGAGVLPGDAAARLDGMESRLRSLTGQIEQMGQQIRALESRGRLPDRTDAAPAAAATRAETRVSEPRQPERDVGRLEGGRLEGGRQPEAGEERSDSIGGLIRSPGNDRAADVGSAPLPPVAPAVGNAPAGNPALSNPPIGNPGAPRQQPASLTTGTGNPREAYERAYGFLLRQDYAAAETGFSEFLNQFPSHELSGNAQYWLGESYYVRGQYRPAANAFLKGYQTYARSQKAPDSLLKLGMSLDKLGQRDAACSSIGELGTRFPTAPAHIQSRAQSERARLGC